MAPSERSWDSLPGSEKAALKELIKAAKYMDPIYNRSVQGLILYLTIR